MATQVNVEEVQYIVFRLVEQYTQWQEPIPKFDTRIPGILESCLQTPFQSFSGQELYPTTVDKAVILFYLMIKNHPFQNGNKRLAIFTLMLYLGKNALDLTLAPMELYNLALEVAASKPNDKDIILEKITRILNNNVHQGLIWA